MRARKGWAAVFAALVMTAVQAANLSVTDVKIAQRYPWNGLVDITYTVNCDDPNKDVWVYPVGYDADTQTSVALMPQYLSGAGASNAVHNGTHQMTWNMAKQMGKDYNRAAFSVTLHAYCDAAPYMVIDLSAGSEAEKYEVTYLSEIPEGGWTDEYKTTKMVFKLISPGTFMMGSPTDESGRQTNNSWYGDEDLVRVTLTQPFYCAIFPITEQQYCLVAGGTTKNPTLNKNALSYDMIRGSVLGAGWPLHQQVDANSLAGRLRLRTGITIDLPTDAQWEYMARAGSSNAYAENPNSWGFCDVCEITEWCLNWWSGNSFGGVDPVGAEKPNGSRYRSWRGAKVYPKSKVRIACRFRRVQANYNFGSYQEDFSSVSSTIGSSERGTAHSNIGARLVALPVCK